MAISINRDNQPVTTETLKNFPVLALHLMPKEISKECCDILNRYGFKRAGGTIISKLASMVAYSSDKVIYNNPTSSSTKPDRIKVFVNHIEITTRWCEIFSTRNNHMIIDLNDTPDQDSNPTVTKTPTPMTTTITPSSPYDAMVEDIYSRVKSRLDDSLPNEAWLRDVITSSVHEEFSKRGVTTIVLEDKRKDPATTTEINEEAHENLVDLIGILKAECWPALVGPTGSGKTLGVQQCARMLGVSIVCIKQMTRIIAPHDLIGYMDANGHYRKGAWTDAILGYDYINNGGQPKSESNVNGPAWIVVDEMDNANENVIMIVKALQTGVIAMPYGQQAVNPQLQVIATMNTWGNGATREYVGRCAQDAALLNEFCFLEWGYDPCFELLLLERLFHSYKSTADYKLEHMHILHAMFQAMRSKASVQGIRCIISTRNLINVAKLLLNNDKWSIDKALRINVYKGLKEEEIKRIEAPEVWTVRREKNFKSDEPAKVVSSSPFLGMKYEGIVPTCPI